MTDTPGPADQEIGANNPPEPTLIERLAAKYGAADGALQIAKMAADSAPLTAIALGDQTALDEAAAFVRRMTAYEKRLDELRVEEKRPHDDNAKLVQQFFNPTINAVVSAKTSVLAVITTHNRAKEDQTRRELLAAAAEERRLADARQEAAAALEADNSGAAGEAVMDHAMRAEETAAAMDRRAAGPVADLVRTQTDGGVVSGTWSWAFTVTASIDLRATLGVLGAFISQADVEKAIRAYAVQCKKLGDTPSLPGVIFTRETKAIVR